MTAKKSKPKKQVCEFGGDAFKDLLLTLGSLSDECCLKVSKKGIKASLVDAAHIAMMHVDAPASVFDDFKVSGDMEIGIDIPKMLKAIKRCSYHVKYIFEDRKMVVSTDSKRYSLSTIDTTGMSDPKAPDLKDRLDSEFTISARDLKEITADAAWISDHLTIAVKGGVALARCQGDLDSYERQIGEVVTSDARSHFPLEYVHNFAKVASGTLTIRFGSDYPMQVTWNTDTTIYDGSPKPKSKPGMKFVFHLAPRIEDGSEDYEPSANAEAQAGESQDVVEEQAEAEIETVAKT